MKKEKIIVPGNIRFMSEWKEFDFRNFPSKCIIDKQLPGCGFTELCLSNNDDIILAVPRRFLGRNKYDQHEGEVYLVVNEMDKDLTTDKDISKETKDFSRKKYLTQDEIEQLKKEKEERNRKIYERLFTEISNYCFSRRSIGLPRKIIVTYDSYRLVQQILNEICIYNGFFTVIDEFQSILHDSRFKSETENQFLRYLNKSPSAIYISATPMMEEYLDMLKDFKDLPYFELDWGTDNPSRIKKPNLKVRTMKSVGTKAKEIIEPFLNGEYKSSIKVINGRPVIIHSTEIILYVNSVNHIISIINGNGLKPEQVNIICSDNDDNRKRIQRKLGKKFDIGSIPKKGEKNKPITLCTRTAYLGVDFYSSCATTYILSDANIDSLAVDISEDLPQILGRIRNEDNPWYNSAFFFYRSTADYNKMEWEDFENTMKKKQKETDNLLLAYRTTPTDDAKYSLASNFQFVAKYANYKSNYLGVDEVVNDKTGDKILIPKVNELVYVNELRAFKIQQIDYADRFIVFSTVHNKLTKDNMVNEEANEFLSKFRELPTMYEKLKSLCESGLSKEAIGVILDQLPDSDEIKSFYNTLGPDRLKALGYNKTNIKRELGVLMFNPLLLQHHIYQDFKVGDKVLLSDAKSKLASIYLEINYSKSPKAVDLEEFFEVKEFMARVVVNGERKRVRGYELLKRKFEDNNLEEKLGD